MRSIKLTEKIVAAAPIPAAGRSEIWDSQVPGLSLRLTPNGVRSWSLRYRVAGQVRRLFIGHAGRVDEGGMSLSTARQIAAEAKNKVRLGTDPAMEREVRKAETASAKANTVAVVADRYLQHVRERNRSWKDTEGVLRRYVLPAWSAKPINAIDRRDLFELTDHVKAIGGKSAPNHVTQTVRNLFNWCVDRAILENSPFTRVTMPVAIPARERVLSDAELVALWRCCDQEAYPAGRVIQLLILTAARLGEVANAKWSEIDLVNAVINIPAARFKSGHGHEIPLSGMALDLMKDLPRMLGGDFVFSARGGKAPFKGFGKLKIRLDKAVTTPWRIHDLRRTSATIMARIGVPRFTIARVLGHSDTSITSVYDRHSYLAEKRAAVEKLAQYVGRLIDPKTNTAEIVPLRR